MNNNGEISETSKTITNDYDVIINNVILTEDGHISTDITLYTLYDASKYLICRYHASGKHKSTDETDPNWNIELQAQNDTKYCKYLTENNEIHFIDTFHKTILTNESLYANTIKYYIQSYTDNKTIAIWISNVLNQNIITGITDIKQNNKQKIYYNLQGQQSLIPFNGINIVNDNGKIYKIIVKNE